MERIWTDTKQIKTHCERGGQRVRALLLDVALYLLTVFIVDFFLAIHNVRYISQSLIIHIMCVYLSSMCSFNRTKRKLLYNSYDIMFLFSLSIFLYCSQCVCVWLPFFYRHLTNHIVLSVYDIFWLECCNIPS